MHLNFIVPSIPVLIILALAHLRVMRLIILDSFPPVAKLRDWFYLRYPPEDSIYTHMYKDESGHWLVATDSSDNKPIVAREFSLIGELASCVWCLGFWIAVLQVVVYVLNPTLCLVLCLPFALGAFSGALWKSAT